MLRKEHYRLLAMATDESLSANVRSKAQKDAHELSLEILNAVRAVKKLEEER